MRKVPEEFQRFCAQFHQDIFVVHPDMDDLFATLLKDLNDDERAAIKRFLDKLLSGAYSTSEIKGVWNRSLQEVGFGKSQGAYEFTVRLRDAIP